MKTKPYYRGGQRRVVRGGVIGGQAYLDAYGKIPAARGPRPNTWFKLSRITVALLIAVLATGCAKDATTAVSTPPISVSPATGTPTPAPAADPIVVNAEKTLAVANHTFDLIVHLERENQAAFAKASPAIHPFVENIRRNGLGWIRTANDLKQAYKHNRDAQSKANLLTALATVSNATNSAKDYLVAAGYGANP